MVRLPEVVDDFIRNFFVRTGLTRTSEAFEAEWYELKATGRLEASGGSSSVVPDVYLHNEVSGTGWRDGTLRLCGMCATSR